MTTYSNVTTYGYNNYITAAEYAIPNIEVTLHTDIGKEINTALEDFKFDSPYEINYYKEAIDIICDDAFEPYDTPDFSSCTSALECVMLEANESTQEAVNQGWEEGESDVITACENLIATALEYGYEDFTLNFSSTSTFGWASHNSETDAGVCIYEKVEGKLFALEIKLRGVYISMCCLINDKVS